MCTYIYEGWVVPEVDLAFVVNFFIFIFVLFLFLFPSRALICLSTTLTYAKSDNDMIVAERRYRCLEPWHLCNHTLFLRWGSAVEQPPHHDKTGRSF